MIQTPAQNTNAINSISSSGCDTNPFVPGDARDVVCVFAFDVVKRFQILNFLGIHVEYPCCLDRND